MAGVMEAWCVMVIPLCSDSWYGVRVVCMMVPVVYGVTDVVMILVLVRGYGVGDGVLRGTPMLVIGDGAPMVLCSGNSAIREVVLQGSVMVMYRDGDGGV